MSTDLAADEVYCRDCGEAISERAEICPHCGIRQKDPPSGESDKDPGIAAVASFLVPGLGQVYNGQIGLGIIAGVTVIILAVTVVGLILAVPLWIYLVYHAYKTAEGGGSGSDTGGGTDEVEPLDRAPPAAENTYGVIEHALVWYRENRPKRAITDGYLERFRDAGDLDGFTEAELRYMRDAVQDWGRTMGHVDVGPAVGELEDELGEVDA